MLDGAARLDELVARAVADGQPALGITDHGNMYGTLEFYKECRKQGIKPILGTEAYMAHDHRSERPTRRGRVDDSGGDTEGGRKLYYHLTLLAENEIGYRNLIQLASRAFLEGYYYKPRLDWDLLETHHEGLIATTSCLGGHVLQSLLQGDAKGALEKAGRLQEIFGRDNLFVELQDHGLPAQRDTNPQLIELATKLHAPLLATNDSHYTHREDHESHDALLCVQTGAVLSDPKRFKFEGHEHYLKTADEMRSLFREVPEACDNTLWVAERAEVEIAFGAPQLPNFPSPSFTRSINPAPRRDVGRLRAGRPGLFAYPDRAGPEVEPSGEWWARYQPVDYSVIDGKGSEQDLRALVAEADRCGLNIIADVVFNHMANMSEYADLAFPNLSPADFHQRCAINYRDGNRTSEQQCWLGGLPDLDQTAAPCGRCSTPSPHAARPRNRRIPAGRRQAYAGDDGERGLHRFRQPGQRRHDLELP